MKNLLYKEFKLTISPLFYVLPFLTSLLMLIPSWIYFMVAMYTLFISFPNIFALSKANNDLGFSIMMPVSKNEIVKARIVSMHSLQLLQIVFIIIFAIINKMLYNIPNFFTIPNASFIGLVLILYGIFNIIFFPMHYKSGYKYGWALIFGLIATLVFAVGVEIANKTIDLFRVYLNTTSSEMLSYRLAALGVGIIVYIILGILSYKISAKRFEKVDV